MPLFFENKKILQRLLCNFHVHLTPPPQATAAIHSTVRVYQTTMNSETSPRRLKGEESNNTTSLSSPPRRSNENGDAVTPARGVRQVKSTDGRVFVVR